MNNSIEPILLDSTDQQAVQDLVMSLIQSDSTEYTVLNEHGEDITHEIKKLVSLNARMIQGQ
ncbi:hypothetical protein PCC7418_1343 [Halothece sp. PCC 7418]|uniref:hypothetical protein n=1 Tax=Halothece sp. (strain PCC 7418) TaxID=65093 RepID=UPI0002A08B47|nr:hypothetical protein [Halothece sp. PCC 7418]AFZ43541.1 hypothetical protein PCC7418_1343 [Halothece sp. PCC 7418]